MTEPVNKLNAIRMALLLVVAASSVGCRKEKETAPPGMGETAVLVRDADLPPTDRPVGTTTTPEYTLDDGRYRQWTEAQRELDLRQPVSRRDRLSATNATPSDIDRAVRYLEGNEDTRRALAASGMSARDYVLTTLALAQARGGSTDLSGATDNERFFSRNRDDFERRRARARFRVLDDDDDNRGRRKRGHGRDKRDSDGDSDN